MAAPSENDPAGPCPDPADVAAFHAGALADDRLEALAAHLAACPACAAATAPPDDLLRDLAGLRGRDPPDRAAVERELSGLRGSTSFDLAMAATPTEPGVPPPDRLGEYRLLEKLGEGGMGAVYRAVHDRLDKVVAVKVLPAGRLNDPAAVARFRREMKAVGRLAHPSIVQATDAGEAAGTHFLVMEYVPGIDLARVLARHGRLAAADAGEVARQAAKGLHHAHGQGLVHRDLKPSNLMLAPGGRVKVLDLGLALLAQADAAGRGLSDPGLVLGSFDYMAPEQADDPHRVDHRADQYALGCTLYHLLAGEPPFPGSRYRTPIQKLKAHAINPPPPLRERRPEIPDGLAEVVARLLAKAPAGRFASAAEVAKALAPFAAGSDLRGLLRAVLPEAESPAADEPTAFAPPPASPPPRRRWGRRALLGAALALPAAGGLAALTVYLADENGSIEITGDAPGAAVAVVRDGRTVTVLRPGGERRAKLPAGDYRLQVIAGPADLALDTDKVTVRPRKSVPVGLSRGPGPAARGPRLALAGHTDWVFYVAYSRDGDRIASASLDGTVGLWDAADGELLRRQPLPFRPACVAFSPDGRALVCSSHDPDGSIRLIDVASGDPARPTDRLEGHRDRVWEVAFAPDGRRLASGSHDRTVRVWDWPSGALVQRIPIPTASFVRRVTFLGDSRTLAVVGDPHVHLFDAATGARKAAWSVGAVSSLRALPRRNLLAVGIWSGQLFLLDPARPELPQPTDAHARSLNDLAVAPGERVLASTGHDKNVCLWDVADPERPRRLATLTGHLGPVDPVAFSPDGTTLATGGAGDDYTVRLWDVSAFDTAPPA